MFLETVANPSGSALATQVTLSALSVAFIQWLKNTESITWIHAGTSTLNRALSGVLAILSAVGVHISWAAAVATPGTYTLTFTGVTLTGIGLMAWGIVKSMAFNELTYRMAVKSITPPPRGPVTISGGEQGTATAQEARATRS
jgi:hypothetical protein